GTSWTVEGTLLPYDPEGDWANFLKLSLSSDGQTVYAYGSWIAAATSGAFGERPTRVVFCESQDAGRTWSVPRDVPLPVDCPLEVSHALLSLPCGRLLAPAATLPGPDRLGEQVLVGVTDDGGSTWNHAVVFEDPRGQLGFFEQKLAALGPKRVLATAWTVTLGDYADRPNSYSISEDGGLSWSAPRSTGIQGQTLTPIPLGEDRLIVLYNRRHGDQGIVMCLVTVTDDGWQVHAEQVLYDARSNYQRGADVESGIDELNAFAFGFPTAVALLDGAFLATHWCVERGVCGIRWTRLRVHW
ncbi:MAG: sialidase family protein, partial [Planctomycetaceae bacterium]